MNIIVGFVIIVLGIFFMIYSGVHKNRNKRRTGTVLATCTNVIDRDIGSGEYESIVRHYTFTYIVNGRQYMVANVIGVPGDPKIGEQVTLRYNPRKPQDAGYDFDDKGKEHYILFVGLGLLVIGIICMII